MHSIHAIRWIENLKDTSHELYWFDVTANGTLDTISNVKQFTRWEKRKLPHLKGEYFLSKKLPLLYQFVRRILKVTENEALEAIILSIQPDIVHSFEMQSCSYPILKTMQKYPHIKWIYSCWGSDIFYYQNFKTHKRKMKNVLKRVNYIHTDCNRDFKLAQNLNFNGTYVGSVPGGSGYKLNEIEKYKIPIKDRKIILVKGYEHRFGRALNVIKSLELISNDLNEFDVVVFGAHDNVKQYIDQRGLGFKYFDRHELLQEELLGLMGKAYIYIGNSISDGIPNTLLEALVMGAFPIQSNPGGATSEVISHETNGLLINDPENVIAISQLIREALKNKELIFNSKLVNDEIAKSKLSYKMNQRKILDIYERIKSQLSVTK